MAPSKATRFKVELVVASYPDAIQSIVFNSLKTYLNLQQSVASQQNTIDRFADDANIPGGAKIEFKLHSTAEVMDTDEFKTQNSAMVEAVKTFQDAARKSITEVAKLRMKQEKSALWSNLILTMQRLCEMLLIENDPTKTEYPRLNHFAWYACKEIDTTIFGKIYSTKDAVQNEFRRLIDDSIDGSDANNAIMWEPGEQDLYSQLSIRIKPILKALFVDSWNAFCQRRKTIEVEKSLNKKAKTILLNGSNNNTMNALASKSFAS